MKAAVLAAVAAAGVTAPPLAPLGKVTGQFDCFAPAALEVALAQEGKQLAGEGNADGGERFELWLTADGVAPGAGREFVFVLRAPGLHAACVLGAGRWE